MLSVSSVVNLFMNRGLFNKALRELWPATALFGVALLAIEAILAYVLPTFAKDFSAQFLEMKFAQTIIKALLGTDVAGGIGPQMFTSMCWVHPVVLACVWAHAIVCCTRVPAGEVDRGTVDVLLGLPVSRWELLISDSAAWLVCGAAILGAALVGNTIGSANVAPELRPSLPRLFIVLVNLLLLYLAVGGLAWLFSALSDRRGRAMTVVFILVLASFLLNYLAQFWTPAERLSFLSMLNYYRPLFIMRDGVWPVKDMLILLASAAALWTIAGIIFARRDLSTL